jgi:hypothetical protein
MVGNSCAVGRKKFDGRMTYLALPVQVEIVLLCEKRSRVQIGRVNEPAAVAAARAIGERINEADLRVPGSGDGTDLHADAGPS